MAKAKVKKPTITYVDRWQAPRLSHIYHEKDPATGAPALCGWKRPVVCFIGHKTSLSPVCKKCQEVFNGEGK